MNSELSKRNRLKGNLLKLHLISFFQELQAMKQYLKDNSTFILIYILFSYLYHVGINLTIGSSLAKFFNKRS